MNMRKTFCVLDVLNIHIFNKKKMNFLLTGMLLNPIFLPLMAACKSGTVR